MNDANYFDEPIANYAVRHSTHPNIEVKQHQRWSKLNDANESFH